MPGPCNSKKRRKQQNLKEKLKSKRLSVSLSVHVLDASPHAVDAQDDERARTSDADAPDEQISDTMVMEDKNYEKESAVAQVTEGHRMARYISRHSSPTYLETNTSPLLEEAIPPQPLSLSARAISSDISTSADIEISLQPPVTSTGLENPFISDPGNGPRVKDAGAFLASFFCPPPSLSDETCASFARTGVLHVLEAVLPKEIALIVWFNKTRKYRRICPACQRLYQLGDALPDPISGELVDVYDPHIPPQVLREQQISGICSSPCFLLASYTSHPYVAEVARGAWGLLAHELSAQTRALLDTTDPATAALMRYGIDAWEVSQDLDRARLGEQGPQAAAAAALDDLGLGRGMRMTRRVDMGLGDVLKALEWAEEGGVNGGREVTERDRRDVEVGNGNGNGNVGGMQTQREMAIRAPVGIRA